MILPKTIKKILEEIRNVMVKIECFKKEGSMTLWLFSLR